jgi:uncharacterized protein (TIGR03437 family)
MGTLKFSLLLVAVAGALAAQPMIATGGVIDGASFVKGQAVAPGSLVSIFGTGLADSLQSGDTVPLSNTINDVSVTFNGIPAGLYFVSAGQVNAQLPWNVLPANASSGTVNAIVTKKGVASAAAAVPINSFSPGLFSIPPGAGYAIAINPDGSIAAPAGAIPGFPTRPAKVGDAVILLANGLGPVDIPVANGAASLDQIRRTTTIPTVLIGGQAAQVLFSGLTPQFPGINQVNVVVPDGNLGNSVSIQIRSGGITSPSGISIAVTR